MKRFNYLLILLWIFVTAEYSWTQDLIQAENFYNYHSPSSFLNNSQNVSLIGHWANGPCSASLVSNDIGYFGMGSYLIIANFSNPAAVVELSRFLLSYSPVGFAINGSTLYIADHFGGLYILDVTDKSNPQEIGHYTGNDAVFDVKLYGQYAVIAEGQQGVRILDVSNPANIQEISYFQTGTAYNLDISGNYVYVAIGNSGMQVLDISDPANPQGVATLNESGPTVDVTVQGDYAYLACKSYGVRVVDISNPMNPQDIGGVNPSGYQQSVVVNGNYIFTASSLEGMHIIDISDPLNPQVVGHYDRDDQGYSKHIYWDGNYVYVSDYGNGLIIIDVSDVTNPIEIGSFDTRDGIMDIFYYNNYVYLADGYDGLIVIDINNMANPTEIGHFDINGHAYGLFIENNYAYVAAEYDGLRIIDVSDPVNPVEVSHINAGRALGVYVEGSYAYVCNYSDGFKILNVSDPTNPQVLGEYNEPGGYAYEVYVTGNYAYVAFSSKGLIILDITDPSSPQKIGEYSSSGATYSVHVIGNYAILANATSGLVVLDISDPTNPIQVSQYTNGEFIYRIRVNGNYVYAASYWDGLLVFDISDILHPQKVGYYDTIALANGVSFWNEFVFLSTQNTGIYILKNNLIQNNTTNNIILTYNQIDASSFPTIENYVTVTDTFGHPITGLSESNFTVLEDGQNESPITVTSLGGTSEPIAVALTIDKSGSMGGQKIIDAKNAAIEFVNQMNANDKGAIISFNDQVTVNQSFTSDKNLLINAINSLVSGGGTAIYDALIESVNQTFTQTGRKAIILLTDGADINSTHTLQEAINSARNANLPVYTIGLGVPTGSPEELVLQQIADSTGGQYYNAPNSSDLQQLYLSIAQQLQNQYKITYNTHNPNADGTTRTVEISVNYQGDTDSKTKAYTAPVSGNLTPIFASTNAIQSAGSSFWVDIQVGDSINSVTNLFGVSFSLHYTNTQYIDVVSPYGSNVVPGSFMGSNVVFLPYVDDPNGQVDIGISRQAGQGGVSGYGSVARIQFSADLNTPHNMPILFSIDNITANDPNGNPIQLDPQDVTITISSIIVWPGDANNDGTANVADVLPLGLYYNSTGPSRPNASVSWTGQMCPPGWNPQNAAYADCNGDGTINVADVLPIGLNYNQTHSKSHQPQNWQAFDEKISSPQVRYTVYDKEMHPTHLSAIGNGDVFYLGLSIDNAKDFVGVSFTLDWQSSSADVGGLVIDRNFGQNGLRINNDWQPYLLTMHQLWESEKRCEFGFTLKGFDKRYDGSELAVLKCIRSGNGLIEFNTTDLVALDWEGQYYQSSNLVGISSSTEKPLVVGKDFNLRNYPNPFNPTTTIRFALPQSEQVWLTVYNTLGQQVAVLVNGRQLGAGWHEYNFDASSLANGLYFYRLEVGQQVVTKKMLLMK